VITRRDIIASLTLTAPGLLFAPGVASTSEWQAKVLPGRRQADPVSPPVYSVEEAEFPDGSFSFSKGLRHSED